MPARPAGLPMTKRPRLTGSLHAPLWGERPAARPFSSRRDALWDFDYEPTRAALAPPDEGGKKNGGKGSIALGGSRPIGREGPGLTPPLAFGGTDFSPRLSSAEQKEVEIRV